MKYSDQAQVISSPWEGKVYPTEESGLSLTDVQLRGGMNFSKGNASKYKMYPIELQRFSAFFVAFLFVAFYQKVGAQVLIPNKILVIAAPFLMLRV